MRGAAVSALALERAPTKAGEVGFGPRFVQKNQLGRVETRLLLAPKPPRPGDVGAVLLAGAECLFLYVRPIFPKTTLIACKEHFSPAATRISLRVRSFFLASKARSCLRWVATIMGLRPEKRCRGAMSQVRRRCWRSFLTMPNETRKRSAISARVPSLLSYAAKIRSRRSSEVVRMSKAYLTLRKMATVFIETL